MGSGGGRAFPRRRAPSSRSYRSSLTAARRRWKSSSPRCSAIRRSRSSISTSCSTRGPAPRRGELKEGSAGLDWQTRGSALPPRPHCPGGRLLAHSLIRHRESVERPSSAVALVGASAPSGVGRPALRCPGTHQRRRGCWLLAASPPPPPNSNPTNLPMREAPPVSRRSDSRRETTPSPFIIKSHPLSPHTLRAPRGTV